MRTLLLLLLVASCNSPDLPPNSAWQDAPETHACSRSQIDLVEAEFKVCNKTSFLSSYCYGAAVLKYCTKVNNPK